jgi:hypothetical protein
VEILDVIAPDWQDNLADTLSTDRLNVLGPQTPTDNFEHWEAALKFGWTKGPASGSLSYLYGFNDIPTLRFDPKVKDLFFDIFMDNEIPDNLLDSVRDLDVDKILHADYDRIHQFGMDFEANAGGSVLRAEGIFVLGRNLYDERLNPEKHPGATYTVAADFVLPLDLNFNIQLLRIDTINWHEDLLTSRATTFFISYLQGEFVEDRLEFYTALMYNISGWSIDKMKVGDWYNEDLQLTAKISYDVLQELNLGVGVYAFAGPEDQIFGQIHDRSFWFFDLKYSF